MTTYCTFINKRFPRFSSFHPQIGVTSSAPIQMHPKIPGIIENGVACRLTVKLACAATTTQLQNLCTVASLAHEMPTQYPLEEPLHELNQ
jgi:hypothetical protein